MRRFKPMTRNRDRRLGPPSGGSRKTPRPAGAKTSRPPAIPALQAPPGSPRRDRPDERREAKVSRIYGFHSVAAALKAPRRELIRLYATSAAAERLKPDIAARGLETRIMSLEEISARAPRDAVHQGVLLEARPLAPIDVAELPANGLVLVLDQVTDPHNVGAILRTGAAFAVDALVLTERHSPEFAGALAKSASGGLEHVPVCSVANLARALADMGDMGYFRIGLDSEAPVRLSGAALSRPLALVLGAEGKGLRRLTRERCDLLARLDLPGAIKSLNVSNACAVALALVHERLPAEG
jgi:23S rRNA (guanosine2251-2'-O)-methyltransferase